MRYLALLPLAALGGCVLPANPADPIDFEAAEDASRVLELDETGITAVDRTFSFVIDADGPQVVLAHLWDDDTLAVGEPSFARRPWVGDELAVRKDVDVHAVPVELLARQGEPFVVTTVDGQSCSGHLGALSELRLIFNYNVGELTEVSDEEYEELNGPSLDLEGLESPRLNDPAFIWDAAEHRAYLTARFEPDDDCEVGTWGAHPDHALTQLSMIDATPFEARAHDLFVAHPEYDREQAAHDEYWQDGDVWLEGYREGPWEAEHFELQAFEAPHGRRIVLAWADETVRCGGPEARLHLLFDVTDGGELILREKIDGVPWDLRGLLEDADGSLMFLTYATLQSAVEFDVLADISAVQTSCGC